jgi:heat shock protein HslJ
MPAPRTLPTVLLAAALAAGAQAPALAGAADAPALDRTAWVLAELPGHVPSTENPASLHFEKGRAVGHDGCNRFTAPYKAQGTALEIVLGPSTMMACPPERVHQAQAFLAALGGARGYRIDGDRLVLTDFEGGALATLARQPAALAGTSWRATAVNNGKQAVVSVVKDSEPTLEFLADGKAAGSAGCNRYTTTYSASGSKLTFAAAAATRKMCARPEIMEQEQSFLSALATVASARFEGDRLELRTAADALAVALGRIARPAP